MSPCPPLEPGGPTFPPSQWAQPKRVASCPLPLVLASAPPSQCEETTRHILTLTSPRPVLAASGKPVTTRLGASCGPRSRPQLLATPAGVISTK